MGVAGLWEVLRPAGQVRSLTELAVEDGFNANTSHQRGFRIGIDASIWFFHAAYGKEGENPELRTLFFRCCRLLQSPLLPLFVFDGPNRPAIKRGKRVGGNAHWLTQGMKNIIDAFGFEWRVAPGEAEAELAYLNRVGIIDAVLSDDVDNFLFGATMVIRNPSNTLSGNRAHPVKNAQGKDDGNHVVTYTADAILSNPSVGLSRTGTILIGLLSGGDYIPAGLPGCGQKFATGLARAGFGDSLAKAVRELKGSMLDDFLDQWRQDIKAELKTNKSGLLPTKKPSLASSLPDDFPSLPVLMSYADPITSENTSQKGNCKTPLMWGNDPDPMRIASLCELYFEWGVKDVIVHRFRTVLWPGVVCRAVRRAVVDEDVRRHPSLVGARDRGNEEDDDTDGRSSPTKWLSSTFSSLALSSPKKSSTLRSSASDPPASQSFTLSSLVSLTSHASPSSSRSVTPSSPTSDTSGSSPLLIEVLSQRTHASTDCTLEYRVLVNPTILVKRAESGVKGLRPPLVGGLFGMDPEDDEEDGAIDQDADESGSDDDGERGIERLETAANAASRLGTKRRKARREVPTKPLRMWLPACMIRAAAPELAEAYEEKVRIREEKKAKRGTKGVRGRRASSGAKSTARITSNNDTDDDGDEPVAEPSIPKPTARWRAKSKVARVGGGGRRRKPKQASEAQDDAYEFIDLSAGESPCSSDGEGSKVNANGKGKAKAKTGQTECTTNASTKAHAMNKKTTAPNTMNGYFNTAKPSAARATKSKSSSSRVPGVNASALNPGALGRTYEEDSTDAAVPPPLPKSSRPLDLVRTKSKAGTTACIPTSKSKSKSATVPRYEEEESSSGLPPARPSGSRPNSSSLSCRPVQPAFKARKKPLFVDVSDTDSDVEVNDIRQPFSGATVTVAHAKQDEKTGKEDDGDVSVSVTVGKTPPTFASERNVGRTAGSMIDLTANGNALGSASAPSTSIPATLLPRVHQGCAALSAGTIDPMAVSRSPSKLAHILLSHSVLESEEERSGEDELPTFHRGPTKSRSKKRSTTNWPAPRPFPMQLASGSESPASPCTTTLGKKGRKQDDEIEIVDIFTTPRGPSPPPSPTPSPSPLSAHASTGPSTSIESRESRGFPASPTQSRSRADAEQHRRPQPRRHASSDLDTPVSGNEKNGILKSPRKSKSHSSPRHAGSARERASSPTPFALTSSGSMQMDDTVGRKPRASDASVIYISSGSEDEGSARPDVDYAASEDECTDRDAGAWADTGMILSAPPSPVPPAIDGPVPAVQAVGVAHPNPLRVSKFKPAPTAASKVDMRAPARITTTNLKLSEDIVAPPQVRRAPLLVARSRRKKGGDDDIIDLTSD